MGTAYNTTLPLPPVDLNGPLDYPSCPRSPRTREGLSPKKQRGAFYTPPSATQILAEWAVREPTDYVLEPGFGGCEFLLSVKNRLSELGSEHPEDHIFGCDVDPHAFSILDGHFSRDEVAIHFLKDDFLSLEPSHFPRAEFNAVLGNPPYVSLHNMSAAQRATSQAAIARAGFKLGAKASLWAYFVLHSLRFLQQGGRIAWILPGSFLYADYSKDIRETLKGAFLRCLAVTLEERLFLNEGTEESTVVLVCEGFGYSKGASIDLGRAVDLADLQEMLDDWSDGAWQRGTWSERPQLSLLSSGEVEGLRRLEQESRPLSDFLEVRIGIVTGANRFFVIDEAAQRRWELPDGVISPIVAKFSHCRGLDLHAEDLRNLRKQGVRCLLVNTAKATTLEGALSTYLDTFPKGKQDENKTFQKRAIWHQADDGQVPDAFFSCMQAEGPTLVINSAGTTCTNTVHRVFFRPNVSGVTRKLIAVSLQSTFSQLSAEIEGRSYGSGGLKLEPSEARRIRVLLPPDISDHEVESIFARLDSTMRSHDRAQMRLEADRLFVQKGCMDESEVSLLANALARVRQSRRAFRTYRKTKDKQG